MACVAAGSVECGLGFVVKMYNRLWVRLGRDRGQATKAPQKPGGRRTSHKIWLGNPLRDGPFRPMELRRDLRREVQKGSAKSSPGGKTSSMMSVPGIPHVRLRDDPFTQMKLNTERRRTCWMVSMFSKWLAFRVGLPFHCHKGSIEIQEEQWARAPGVACLATLKDLPVSQVVKPLRYLRRCQKEASLTIFQVVPEVSRS